MRRSLIVFASAVFVCLTLNPSVNRSHADDKPFSGPQPGEPLPAFKVQGVFDSQAGETIDFVAKAGGKPLVLIFVHDVNRQSIGFTRALATYTVSRASDGLSTGVIWLRDDVSEAEAELKRVRHALAKDAPVGISLDGKEGPGSYGLNREVMLTILIGNDNKVTANFALVQPSLQVDLQPVIASVVEVIGGEVPTASELLAMSGANMRNDNGRPGMRDEANRKGAVDPDKAAALRDLLRPVIRRDASESSVDEAAKRVEDFAENDEAIRREIGRIANQIIRAGKLSDYGTPHAQTYLQRWADTYPKPANIEASR
jgi:hypothetical protein